MFCGPALITLTHSFPLKDIFSWSKEHLQDNFSPLCHYHLLRRYFLLGHCVLQNSEGILICYTINMELYSPRSLLKPIISQNTHNICLFGNPRAQIKQRIWVFYLYSCGFLKYIYFDFNMLSNAVLLVEGKFATEPTEGRKGKLKLIQIWQGAHMVNRLAMCSLPRWACSDCPSDLH